MDRWTASALILGGLALWLVVDVLEAMRRRDRRAALLLVWMALSGGGAVLCLALRP